MNTTELQSALCKSLCSEVKLREKRAGLYFLETPFMFSDGDYFSIYLQELPGGSFRITDRGHTLMHLSYAIDVDLIFSGTRGRLLEDITSELGVHEIDGEFFLEAPANALGEAALRFAQALTKLTDLTFLSRAHVESTFDDDLQELLFKIVAPDRIQKDYMPPELAAADLYPIDYRIEGKERPLFLFGIPNQAKARLTTITLQQLLIRNVSFESLLVFANQETLPRSDLARLSNVGGEQISSLDAYEQFEKKLLKRVAVNGHTNGEMLKELTA
jgi:hypothetical protein